MTWLKNVVLWLAYLPVRLPRGFDSKWYSTRYRDVSESGVWPSIHYRRFGRKERRDPGPTVSGSSDWLKARVGRDQGESNQWLPMLQGVKSFDRHAPTVVFVGHLAGPRLFGAERSLLDLVSATQALRINVFVLLPEADNSAYIEAFARLSCGVKIIPFSWWRTRKKPAAQTVELLTAFYKEIGASAVYLNTITPDEPLIAANKLGLPVAMHLRETLLHDSALSGILEADQDLLECRLSERVDLVVANSSFTANVNRAPEALIVPNGLHVGPYLAMAAGRVISRDFTVGMISSNLPKKGLYDFVELARNLSSDSVRCVLIGPETNEVCELRNQQAQGKLPDNLCFGGYHDSPLEALDAIDVLVNLSRFHETFGRTVLEGMAAGRVVVAYQQGAVPELVEDGKSGVLVKPGDVSAVANAVRRLMKEQAYYERLSQSARVVAKGYDTRYFNVRVKQAIETLVSKAGVHQENTVTQ